MVNMLDRIINIKNDKAYVNIGFIGAQPNAPKLPVQANEFDISSAIELWGPDNMKPQKVISRGRKNSIIGSVLDHKARALYAGGLVYGELSWDKKTGEEIFDPVYIPEIERFLNDCKINRYCYKAALDFYWHGQIFPELILTNDREKIAGLFCIDSAWVRWGKATEKGEIKTAFVSASWDFNFIPSDAKRILVCDPFFDGVNKLRQSTAKKVIYPVGLEYPGQLYYGAANWHSILTPENKWLDLAEKVPAFKSALMDNQISLKYLISFPDYWWETKFPGFENLEPSQQGALIESTIKKLEDFLSGLDNSGKAWITTFKVDEHTQKEFPGIKITPIENKIKDGLYIEDAQEANQNILLALGMPASLIDSAATSKIGAGSGSNVRETFNAYRALAKSHEDLILEPLHFIRDYNKWPPNIQFRFRSNILRTLNTVTPGEREVQ